jgi:hypothetical protein
MMEGIEMTNHTEILISAGSILKERARQYGPEEECFDRISKLATIILNKPISVYDVAMIQVATKLGRLQEARTHEDNYIDAVNYLAFGAQFAKTMTSVSTAVEDDIVAIAKRFAPIVNKQPPVSGVEFTPVTMPVEENKAPEA